MNNVGSGGELSSCLCKNDELLMGDVDQMMQDDLDISIYVC